MESGPLRLGNFLVNARAQQTRERNKRTGEITVNCDDNRDNNKDNNKDQNNNNFQSIAST